MSTASRPAWSASKPSSARVAESTSDPIPRIRRSLREDRSASSRPICESHASPRSRHREADLERDGFSSSRHPALSFCSSMIFSENRCPLFRIMLWGGQPSRASLAQHRDDVVRVQALPGLGLFASPPAVFRRGEPPDRSIAIEFAGIGQKLTTRSPRTLRNSISGRAAGWCDSKSSRADKSVLSPK
jgi:hypothetical protein